MSAVRWAWALSEMVTKAVGRKTSRPSRCVLGLALLVGALAVGRAAHADDTFRDCAECPLMVRIPAGTFTMGASSRIWDGLRIAERSRITGARGALNGFRVARTL